MQKETQEALRKFDGLLGFMQRSDWWLVDSVGDVEYSPDNFTKNDIALVRNALKKLPQVESTAMNGGWVLDCGNIWCKSGDNVLFRATASSEQQSGVLEFSTDTFAWEIMHGSAIIPLGDVYEWHKL